MPTFLPTFELGLMILWILATVGVVFKDKMWRVDSLASVETPKTNR
jgi:hypothetical protein